ncbi:hypothetical protein [Rodentibacter caecimuris]|uniref:hypothetical protein n=1 Tax=Rodentibacter caecimuris TaxID=1796644 RepID=UPI00075190CD|nr:hypothetical protein [Rodentibacter heylii]
MFNYMGHKFKAIKQKTVTKTKPYFSKLEKALGFIFIILIFVFSILVFIGKTNIGLVLSLCISMCCFGYLPIQKHIKIKDFEYEKDVLNEAKEYLENLDSKKVIDSNIGGNVSSMSGIVFTKRRKL